MMRECSGVVRPEEVEMDAGRPLGASWWYWESMDTGTLRGCPLGAKARATTGCPPGRGPPGDLGCGCMLAACARL